MRRTLAALALLLAAPASAEAPSPPDAPAARPVPLPPPPGGLPVKPPPPAKVEPPTAPSEEEVACRAQADVVERREKLFRGQGLPADEIERRNAAARQQLAACLTRQREERAIRAEIAARTPPGASAAERARVERDVRLAHARAHPEEERTDEERRLLAQERERLERERRAPPPAPAPTPVPDAPAEAAERDPAEARRVLAVERGLSEAEAQACRSELGVLEQRRRVLSGRHLSPEESRRRNAPHEQALADCLTRHRRDEKLAADERKVLAEIAAQTPPVTTERERDRIAREVRLRHARAKPRDERTSGERALVAEAEVAEARQREAEARLRDPVLRRRALSGQQCAHQARRDRARQELAEEERIAALGGGDRQRAYFLRAELRRDEEVLRQNGLELQAAGGALPCGERFVGRVARCVDARIDGRPLQDCESEEMQLALSALVR